MDSSTDPVPTVEEHIRSLAKASHALSKLELRTLNRLCEVSKEVLNLASDSLVEEASGEPFLRTSSCDGTPVRLNKVLHIELPIACSRQHRRIRESLEYLVANSFIRWIRGPGHKTVAQIRDPLPSHMGKVLGPSSARVSSNGGPSANEVIKGRPRRRMSGIDVASSISSGWCEGFTNLWNRRGGPQALSRALKYWPFSNG